MKGKSILFIFLLLLTFGGLALLHYEMTDDTLAGKKEVAMLIAERLNDAVEMQIGAPIKVSRAMAEDTFLKRFLKEEKDMDRQEAIDVMMEFLTGIRDSNDYVTAFVVSDATGCYYTQNGFNKVVDPHNNHHDIWYSIFINSDDDLTLDVDVDETNDKRWTVFVNSKIKDETGRLLGVCGVGVVVSDLQELFVKYHDMYNVDVRLVNKDGLVQVDVSNINIEATYNANNEFSDDGDYVYTDRGDRGYEVSRFLQDLRWYLVVSQKNEKVYRRDFNPLMLLLSMAAFLVIAVLYFFIFRIYVHGRGDYEGADTDPVTGLWTYDYYLKMYGERGIFQSSRYKALAVIDIDHFTETAEKEAREILLFFTRQLRLTIGEMGDIYQWDTDKFVILLQWSPDFAFELLRQICREMENDGRVTVSVGLTGVHLSDSIKRSYYRAMQGCCLVKEMGGNGVKRVSEE